MGLVKSSDGRWPWLVCGVLLLATLLNYMDRQALAVSLPALKDQFDLVEGRVGKVEASFGFAFAFGALFFGWLADRAGPRLLYPLVVIGWSLAGIATSFAGQPWVASWLEADGDPPGVGVFRWLLLCRTALGAFEAGHWPCALLTVRAILAEKDRTLGNGILQSGASIGAVIVPFYVEAAERAGQTWEFAFWSIGLAGMCWVPVWFASIGNHPLSAPKTELPPPLEDRARSNGLLRRLAVLAIIVSTLTISWQFLRAWIALFLQDHHGYSREGTRALISGYFIAADVGCLLSGALVRRLTLRGWPIHSARVLGYFLFSLLTACGALVPFAGNGPLMIALLFTAGAGILGLHPYYYALTQDLSTRHMGKLSGALAAMGWIVSSLWQYYLGNQIQATKSYRLGLLMVGLAPMIGLIALLIFWPNEKRDPIALTSAENS